MQAMECSSYKATIEAVEISFTWNPEHPRAVQWELSPKLQGRCLTVFVGDCRILPGEHMISREMPINADRAVDAEGMLAYHTNLSLLLSMELGDEGYDKDSKRIGLLTACLGLVRSQACSVTRDAAFKCKEVLNRCLTGTVQEHKQIAQDIKQMWLKRPWMQKRSKAEAKVSE